ncbi:MAG: S41 family peptidase [Bacteroidia bacterium]|nr:S41 family peptidase [Bacteroidia bacterium]MBP7260524.1 S41 family peptidase [Bacteroidia bacterium]MBP9179533.1 S41 family peptidase [Bacteroidia bacterium]MBP9724011.1 S41 family peptidase [Bacteroidia bacterium]
MKQYVFYILIVIFTSCRNGDSHHISPVAKSYIDEVITLLQNNSINKNKINWEDFRNDVYRHAKGSRTIDQTYTSITYAIDKLEDHHSYFAANIVSQDTSDLKPLPILQDEIVPENIGYIRIGFCMGDEQQKNNYINSIVDKIAKQDKIRLKGWIVDLRGNFGGDMVPMLVAIGPILGEGILGYFFYPDSSFYTWNYKNGYLYDENGIWWEQSTNSYHLKSPNPYVAILTDNVTASSGEAVAIAFKGRNKTKSFGIPTFGVSTSNRSYTLSDGSRINLTVSVFADRNKIRYGSSVYPDVVCEEKETLVKAINWISTKH